MKFKPQIVSTAVLALLAACAAEPAPSGGAAPGGGAASLDVDGGSSTGDAGQPGPGADASGQHAGAALIAHGSAKFLLNGTAKVLDYEGATATVALGHPSAGGCVGKAYIAVEQTGGACKLELWFGPVAKPAQLKLVHAIVHGRREVAGALIGCDALGSMPGSGPLMWQFSTGDTIMAMPTLPGGDASSRLTIKSATFDPKEPSTLVQGASQGTLELDGLSIDGDAFSDPDNDVTCSGPAPASQHPSWQGKDIQPKSPDFGKVHGLSTYAGKRIAVFLAEGW